MRRFMANRWWTFILALCIGLSSVIGFTPSVLADEDTGPGYGDPDMPAGPYVPGGERGGSGPKGDDPSTMFRTVGDGARGMSAWMSRLHLVIRGLYFRF